MDTTKMVVLQICLAVIAIFIIGWIFFKERPQVIVNQKLQQKLSQVQKENQELQVQVKPVQQDRKQSREYVRAWRNLFHQQKYDEAIAQYDKALEFFPDDPYALSLKGYTLFRAGHIPESIEANRMAIQLDPGDPLNYIDLAKSYCAAKQYEDAKRALLNDPPPETASSVNRYVQIDGEIRHVCMPILGQLPEPAGRSDVE